MSTNLKKIKGLVPVSTNNTFDTKYEDAILSLTSFYGGDKRGKCLSLSIYSNDYEKNDGKIQITKDDAKELIRVLKEFIK